MNSSFVYRAGWKSRQAWSVAASVLFHGTVLFVGMSLLYQQADFSVSAGGGKVGARLVSWEDVSEISAFKPRPVIQAPPKEAFVLPEEKKSAPAKPEVGTAEVEGDPGPGEGMGEVTRLAQPWSNPFPPYPRELRAQGIEGSGLVRIFIDKKGRVERVMVLKSSGHPGLDQAMVDTVTRRWRFRPAKIGPMAVAAHRDLPFQFKLDD